MLAAFEGSTSCGRVSFSQPNERTEMTRLRRNEDRDSVPSMTAALTRDPPTSMHSVVVIGVRPPARVVLLKPAVDCSRRRERSLDASSSPKTTPTTVSGNGGIRRPQDVEKFRPREALNQETVDNEAPAISSEQIIQLLPEARRLLTRAFRLFDSECRSDRLRRVGEPLIVPTQFSG
jgi:hypothetical protein